VSLPPDERRYGALLRAALPSPATDPEHAGQVRRALDARLAGRRRHERRLWVAALVAVPAVIAAIVLLLPRPASRPESEGAAHTAHATPANVLDLRAGARVLVRPDSGLSVERDEPLVGVLRLRQGFILIDADKRPGRTFTIFAGDTRVDVVGTLFAVEQVPGRGPSVRVIDGVVQVTQGATTTAVGHGQTWPAGATTAIVTADDLVRLRADGRRHSEDGGVVGEEAGNRDARGARAGTVDRHERADRKSDSVRTTRGGVDKPSSAAQSAQSDEDALYAEGRAQARRGDTATALRTFAIYRQRHGAHGAYARAVDVQVLDLLLGRGEKDRARAEADQFLVAYPNDPRADRFRLARAVLNAERGACMAALADIATLPDGDVTASVRQRCDR
jgi:hypothetical protein